MKKSKFRDKWRRSDEPAKTKNNILLDINGEVFNHMREVACKEVEDRVKSRLPISHENAERTHPA